MSTMNRFFESRGSAPFVRDTTNQFSMNIESRDDGCTITPGSQSQKKRFAEHQLERDPVKHSALANSYYLLDNQGTYCFECQKDFCRPSVLSRHRRSAVHDPSRRFLCPYEWCGESFTRRDSRNRHIDAQHGISKLTCSRCGAHVRKDALKEHQATNLCRTTAAQRDEDRKSSGEYPPSSVDTSPYPNPSTGFGTPASYVGTHITTPDEAGPSQVATPHPNKRSDDSMDAMDIDDNDDSTLGYQPSPPIEDEGLEVVHSKLDPRPLPHSPPLRQAALMDPHPNTVPDSPKLFFGEKAFDPVWANQCTDMEGLEADVVQWRKQVLPE